MATCPKCGSYDPKERWCMICRKNHHALFTDHPDCDNSDLHSTQIVSDSDTIGGMPRIDGHRIGVCHVIGAAREAIIAATKINYPQLTEDEVNAVVDYAFKVTAKHDPASVLPVEAPSQDDWWLIRYDDADVPPTILQGESVARKCFAARLLTWNCQLFKMVDDGKRRASVVEAPTDELWLEFIVDNLCSLCGNKGVIDTHGIRTPANYECGALHYCICPNGRALKAGNADKLAWLNQSQGIVEASREATPDKELVAEMMHKLIQGPEELEECCKWLIQAARAASREVAPDEIRNAALEEAAEECDRHAAFCKDEAQGVSYFADLLTRTQEATYNAQRIRVLKSVTRGATSTPHHYISTACQHGLHEQCRRSCKFCGAICACGKCVHGASSTPQTTPDAATLQAQKAALLLFQAGAFSEGWNSNHSLNDTAKFIVAAASAGDRETTEDDNAKS